MGNNLTKVDRMVDLLACCKPKRGRKQRAWKTRSLPRLARHTVIIACSYGIGNTATKKDLETAHFQEGNGHQAAAESATIFLDDVLENVGAEVDLNVQSKVIVQNVHKVAKNHQAAEESATLFLDDLLEKVGKDVDLKVQSKAIVKNVYKAVDAHQAAEESATIFLDDVLQEVQKELDLKAQSKAIVEKVYKEVGKEFELRAQAKTIVQNVYEGVRKEFEVRAQAKAIVQNVYEEVGKEFELKTQARVIVQNVLETVGKEFQLRTHAKTIVQKAYTAVSIHKDVEDSAQAFLDTILKDVEKVSQLRECTQTVVHNVFKEVSKDFSLHAQTRDSAKEVDQVDYADLCLPQSYYLSGIKIDTTELQARKKPLSNRGPWPGKDAITYQDQFITDLRAVEKEIASGKTHDRVQDERHSDDPDIDSVFPGDTGGESDDEDEDSLTISFIMGTAEHVTSLDIIQHNEECIILSQDCDDDDDDVDVDGSGGELGISQAKMSDSLGDNATAETRHPSPQGFALPLTAVSVCLPPIPPPLTFRDIKNLEGVALQKMIKKENIHFPPPYLPSSLSSNIAVNGGSCFMVPPPSRPVMPAAQPLPGNVSSAQNISAFHQEHSLNSGRITGYPINPLLPLIPPTSPLIAPPPYPPPDEMSRLLQLAQDVREHADQELINQNLPHLHNQGNDAQHWGRPPANRRANPGPPTWAQHPQRIPLQPVSRPRPPMTIRRCYEHNMRHARSQRRGFNN